MIKLDEDALICDLAETYHILDYRQLPIQKVAVLAFGLRDDSRIKMRMTGTTINLNQMLLSMVTDRLSYLMWFKTEDGQKNRNRPPSVLEILTSSQSENNVVAFESGDEFMQARKEIINQYEG